MTNRNRDQLTFPICKGRKVEAEFNGGTVTSDAGILLLRQADRHLGLTASVARVVADSRRQASCDHTVLSMLRQRVDGLAAGYEDLIDHDSLRHDLAWQTVVERDKPAASSPTLCRMENRIKKQMQFFAHRTSAMRWWPNQFRLLLASLAYVLLEASGRLGLAKFCLKSLKTVGATPHAAHAVGNQTA